MIVVRTYETTDYSGLDHLWKRCFPDDPPHNHAAIAVPAKLAVQDNLLLVAATEPSRIVGSIMAGYDGHRGWLYSVAVDPAHQRAGIGRILVEAAVSRLVSLGCGKVNIQIRAGNEAVIAFYAGLGFSVEPRISMGMHIGPLSGS